MKQILLSLSAIVTMYVNAQNCSELFISEYVDGTGNNNAIEIYNPTTSNIDLNGYSINRYGNGASSNPDSWPLSGNIAAGQAITVGNGQLDSIWVSTYWSVPVNPIFYAACDQHGSGIYPTPFYFNGDDAMTLEKNGNIVDIFGKVGEDPGGAWTDDASAGYTDANGGSWWTKYKTLVRKPSVKQGITMNPIVFNPTLEYDSLPKDTYTGMGSHSCDCNNSSTVFEKGKVSYVMYPNPANTGEVVKINATKKIETIAVTNILGKTVHFSNSINTKSLSKGTFIIKINFSDGTLMKNKLIVE